MPKKSRVAPTEIENILARIKNAERVRDEADEMFGYADSIKLYEGKFAEVVPKFMSGIDIVPINEVYAYVKTFIPSVYSRDPYITVIPKGKRFIVGAKLLEMSINGYWRLLQLKRQMRQVIFDAIFAEGWMKVGYSASLGKVEKGDGDKTIFPSDFIQKDEIFATRVSWKNMVRDPDAVDGLNDARFVAQKIILPLDAVKAASYYENTEDLNPNYTVDIGGSPMYKGGPDYRSEESYVVLWEMWDQDEMKVYTIAEGHDKYLMNKKWPYKFTGFPYERMVFNETFDQSYAPNLIQPWIAQLWEKIKIRSMELDHIKRFGRQYWAEKGSLSRMSKDMLKKGITGSVIETEPGKGGPTPIQYPPIQTDMYAVENRIDMDKDNISGQPNVVRSAPQKTQSRTLGELDRLMSSFNSRQSDPQTVVEDFSQDVAKKLINLQQQYFNVEKFIRATSSDVQFLEREMQDNPMSDRLDKNGFLMRSEDIKSIEFEVEVRIGSTLPMDRQNRMKSMVSIIELGERVGIMPGDKVSRVIGKNLINDFDMPEIIQAYDETLRKIAAAEAVQREGSMAMNQLRQKQIAQLEARVKGMGGANGNQAAQGPVIPPELVS